MEHTKHLWRAGLLILAFAAAGVTVRHFLIPDTFGVQGFYRYGSVSEFMSKPAIHGDVNACNECHADVAELKLAGKHASVSCEVCHDPLSTHITDGEKTADMRKDTSPDLCAYCHQRLRARPVDMPQVDLREHLVSQEVISEKDAIPDGACAVCHDVHSPGFD